MDHPLSSNLNIQMINLASWRNSRLYYISSLIATTKHITDQLRCESQELSHRIQQLEGRKDDETVVVGGHEEYIESLKLEIQAFHFKFKDMW